MTDRKNKRGIDFYLGWLFISLYNALQYYIRTMKDGRTKLHNYYVGMTYGIVLSAITLIGFGEYVKHGLNKDMEYARPLITEFTVIERIEEVEKWRSVKEEPEEYIKLVFGEHADRALAIAKCESGLRASATNVNVDGTVDKGIFQINNHFHGECSTHDAKKNVDCAKRIFDSWGNFKAWVCDRYI